MSKANKNEKLVAFICTQDRVQYNNAILRDGQEVFGKPSVLGKHAHFQLKSDVEEAKAAEEAEKAELRSFGKSNDELIDEVTYLTSEIIRYTEEVKALKAENAALKKAAKATPAKKETAPAAGDNPDTSGDDKGDDDDLPL